MSSQQKRLFRAFFERYVNYKSNWLARVVSAIPVDADEEPLFTASNPGHISGEMTFGEGAEVAVSSMPDVVISEMPDVVISEMPDVVISEMPAVTPVLYFAATEDAAEATLIAGQANKKIKVRAVMAVTDIASTVTLISRDEGAGTPVTGEFALAANGGFVMPMTPEDQYWFETETGEGLVLTQTADATLGINICYVVE